MSDMHPTDLLGYTSRDLEKRRSLATKDRYASQTPDHRAFGYDYFDNPDGMGYGGYAYDGRYAGEVRRIADFFGMSPPARVLEVGCAKGFVLVEFQKLGFCVTGIDKSEYASANCHEELKGSILNGSAVDFDFPESYFDLAVCKEMLPHVEPDEAAETIRRINRWAKNALLVIQCVENEANADRFRYWDATHKIAMSPEGWVDFLKNCGFRGYYHLKVIL